MKQFSLLIIFFLGMVFFQKAIAQDDNPFKDYKLDTFMFQNRLAKVVIPKKSNERKLWVWRARFWGGEPQTDLALLEKGFHLVYIDVAGLYGNPKAVQLWNNFYTHVTETYSLSDKAVLEGFSRGGLIVYNWAARNVDKVACIYADAPVCDIKSWPGGLYKGEGSPGNWKECLKAYGLDTTAVLQYPNIPIYNAIQVARAGIPAIHVCGDSDKVVPYEENTAILVKNFEQAGGEIKVILKEGVGHHPHSLEDPTPIVEFIMESLE